MSGSPSESFKHQNSEAESRLGTTVGSGEQEGGSSSAEGLVSVEVGPCHPENKADAGTQSPRAGSRGGNQEAQASQVIRPA